MGYGVDRDGAFQADPKWAGPITGPGPGRRPDAVSWPRMRTRWYRRGGGSPSGRGRSPPVSWHGKPGVDKPEHWQEWQGDGTRGPAARAQERHKEVGKTTEAGGVRRAPSNPAAEPGKARRSGGASGPARQAQVR